MNLLEIVLIVGLVGYLLCPLPLTLFEDIEKEKQVKLVKIFDIYGTFNNINAYEDVEERATAWFAEHPEAVILASHTNMAATENWTEFALTLIVELPEPEQPTKGGDATLTVSQ